MGGLDWLGVFREMGARVRHDTAALISSSGAGAEIGKGASGDTTLAVDRAAEDVILSVLDEAASRGERFTFISEELGEKSFGAESPVILADPVDGSNNARFNVPFYATSLAMATGRRLSDVVLGYVMNLATRDEFWAARGGGAYMNGVGIRTADVSEAGLLNFECSVPETDLDTVAPLLRSSKKIRCLGSTALDLAGLACGMTHVVVIPSPSRSFDYAAGWLLVLEAGGVVSDTRGKPITDTPLGVGRTVPIMAAANRGLLDEAVGILGGG